MPGAVAPPPPNAEQLDALDQLVDVLVAADNADLLDRLCPPPHPDADGPTPSVTITLRRPAHGEVWVRADGKDA